MSRICVIGGNGMLGRSLLPYLQSAGYQVFCLVREKICQTDIEIDYGNKDSVSYVLNDIKPSHILNLAAMTNVDECEINPNGAYEANVRVVELVCNWIRQAGDCHLVQISTDQVYDGLGPHSEGSVKLLNYYSFSKYSGELAASNVPSTIIRTNFFGKSKSPSRKSFSDWAFSALSREDNISVFNDVFFSPLSLESLCGFIKLIIDKPLIGTFNVGSECGLSKADFVFKFAEILNLSTKNVSITSCENMNLTARRPTDMRMDYSRLKDAYGDIVLPTLADEIQKVAVSYIA